MEVAAFVAFAALVVAWVALPMRGPKVEAESLPERRAA